MEEALFQHTKPEYICILEIKLKKLNHSLNTNEQLSG